MALHEIPKAYDPKAHEDGIYAAWEASGLFNPDNLPGDRPEAFSIVLPPPNVTGTLHMGHAVMLAIEDIMIRFARMRGKKTLWLPGTDHASIATSTKVENIIFKSEGKTRHDLGREEFLKRVEKFASDSHDTIVGQMRKMGASVDWSREAYTLDETRNKAVNFAFKKMYDDGLIYRGHRVVNWDPIGQTTISDIEIVYKEVEATLYTFKYGKDFPIAISSTRPETKVGDTAVAVHPSDERYAKFVGKTFENISFAGTTISIKIIADAEVDPKFGTGALGVTPAHSLIDADIAQRHGLELKQVIGQDGKMNESAGPLLVGKTTTEARSSVVAWLNEQGLVEGEEKTMQNLATAERSGGTIEPVPMLQWFIDVNKKFKRGLFKKATLKTLTQDAVRSGKIEIIPERFQKSYFDWVDNLRDWCISRQLWFGHRIPAWYCAGCGATRIEAQVKGHWSFVRHGETDWNKEQRTMEHADQPLNALGREQALSVVPALKLRKIDLIISSDLLRAKETADILSRGLGGVEVVCDKGLRERNYGDFEGMRREDVTAKFGTTFKYDLVPPNGESFRQVEERAWKAFVVHQDEHRHKNVVVVSHGGTLRMLLKQIRRWTPDQAMAFQGFKNAQATEFDVCDPCERCGSHFFEQDPDTLDTWFSAGIWTSSTLGWPEQTDDLKTYHPTSILETGYDILTFWVVRMVTMTTYLLDQVPFKKVYLHGLVRDEKGRKMSKSLDNIINPLDMISAYGADATRLSLVIGSTPGNDTKLSEEKIAGYRNFTNKLWNISRFVLSSVSPLLFKEGQWVVGIPAQTLADEWILGRLSEVKNKVTQHLEAHELSAAGEALRDFTWNDFADWYLEIAKIQKSENTDRILLHVLSTLLKLWHPFMPFVTEVIWKEMGSSKDFLMIEEWPKVGGSIDERVAREFALVKEVIAVIRNLRAEYAVEPGKFVEVSLIDAKNAEMLETQADVIKGLARVESLAIATSGDKPEGSVAATAGSVQVYLSLAGLVDVEKEKTRLTKERDEVTGYITSLKAKLDNKEFAGKAPAQVVDKMRANLAEAEARLASIASQLEGLSK